MNANTNSGAVSLQCGHYHDDPRKRILFFRGRHHIEDIVIACLLSSNKIDFTIFRALHHICGCVSATHSKTSLPFWGGVREGDMEKEHSIELRW